MTGARVTGAGGGAKRPVVLGITGASGHLLARCCVDRLLRYGYPILVVCTGPGRRVWREELEEDLGGALADWRSRGNVTEYHVNDVGAPIASGGLATAGMLVVPCSMGTLSGIATGAAGNLLERAADVTVKEYRPLVLVPRETPLSPIHLENMLSLARIGVRIVPPMPAFYLRPRTVEDIVDYLAGRVLSALGIPEAVDEPPAYVPTTEPPRSGSAGR
ncbi:MAG TPA: UbiX family flavin prenyltransferase [Chloroflexota bacterium]|nr:UbiX family flavin prenyltransferase [Chloroflexota bacterium]